MYGVSPLLQTAMKLPRPSTATLGSVWLHCV